MSRLSWDLLTRLREGRTNGTALRWVVTPIHKEAAARIATLEAEAAELREKVARLELELALRPARETTE